MREFDLSALGVQAIRGDDVRGGLAPLAVALIAGGVTLIVTHWTEIKQGFADGFNGV